MPLNPYFNTISADNEQRLLDGLIVESISIYGSPVYYLPRRTYNLDNLFTEDPQNYFDTAWPSVAYVKNVEGFEGQGHFLSAMGLEIRDQVTFTVANTTWMEDIGFSEGKPRPDEGDLIFFTQNQKCFEVVFVEKFAMYFPLGNLYSYDLTCQLLEYTGQKFFTGIREIDVIQPDLTENFLDSAWLNEDGTFFITEGINANNVDYVVIESWQANTVDLGDDSATIKTEADAILDWTEVDPFSEGNV